MIYCPQCGNPNFDDANYCDTCGEPLISAEEYAKMRNAAEMQQLLEAQRQQREAAAYNKAYRKAQKDAKKAAKAKNAAASAEGASVPASGSVAGAGAQAPGVGTAASDGQGSAAGTSAAAGAPAPGTPAPGVPAPGAPADFPVYKHGCLAQAWDDITESEGWAKRILLLGLVGLVPILNFFVSGFAMKWARQLPLDQIEGMPKKIFDEGSFLQGFYAFVISLVVGFVSAAASALVGLVPVLGAIVGVAVTLFMAMFQVLSVTRVAISGNLAPGFDVKSIWAVFRAGRLGKLFCATLLPGIIVGVAVVFICGSILVIFGLNSLTSLVDSIQYAQQMEQMAQMNPMMSMFGYSNPWPSVVSQAMALIPLFFVIFLVAMFFAPLSEVLTYRATAHYITRYSHDWCELAPKAA